jgi:ABC-type Fe3+/spermidine/putrescine transport system ATPase subunit
MMLSKTETPARLELRQVEKTIGTARIVNGINLVVAPGESVVLLGPSGCGKTTTLRMVAGFMRPDAGEIRLDGTLASGSGVMVPTERRGLGMVFQNYAVWPHKSVADNIAYGLVLGRVSRPARTERVRRLLEIVRLDELGDRYPAELSGGQQQRVALARAIATEPSLLLLDEPLSNLDAALRQEMRYELKELHRRIGTAMLYVTHDQEEALMLADRVVVMQRGRVEQAAPPEEIYAAPRSRFVASFIGASTLLAGRIAAKDAATGRLHLRHASGLAFWARCHDETFRSLGEGAEAALVVRPEAISLLPEDEAAVPATVTTAAYLGNRYEVQLAAAGTSFQAGTRSMAGFGDGKVSLRFDESQLWIVP